MSGALGRQHSVQRLTRCILPVVTVALALAGSPAARGQASWEYSPYQVRVWLALDAGPQLPGALVTTLGEAIADRNRAVLGGVWDVETVLAPAALRAIIAHDLAQLSVETIAGAAERADLAADKLFLVAITANREACQVAVRELDCRSRQLGPVDQRDCPAPNMLAMTLWDLLLESFTPLARIEQVEGQRAVARLRAGGLAASDDSPVLVQPGMVLRPVVRRNDRSGQPSPGGIQAVPWTFLTVVERRDSVLECSLVSGYRSAVPPRGGVRVERLALLVRMRYDATNLELRSRSEPAKPLASYEVYRRGEPPAAAELLGSTDLDGRLPLPSGAGAVETLIVKNGQQLLARLPVVVGQSASLTAYIVDDDARLAAEGYVAALSSRALDLVARREILAARLRTRLKDGKLDEAQRLLDEFRRLETRADLSRDLDRFRQQLATTDKLTQARIDRLVSEAQTFLLVRPLGDELLNQLTREVTAGRPSGG